MRYVWRVPWVPLLPTKVVCDSNTVLLQVQGQTVIPSSPISYSRATQTPLGYEFATLSHGLTEEAHRPQKADGKGNMCRQNDGASFRCCSALPGGAPGGPKLRWPQGVESPSRVFDRAAKRRRGSVRVPILALPIGGFQSFCCERRST